MVTHKRYNIQFYDRLAGQSRNRAVWAKPTEKK